MKRKPIINPNFFGCATCGTLPFVKLPKNRQLHDEFVSSTNLYINNRNKEIPFKIQKTEWSDNDRFCTLQDIANTYIDELKNCLIAEILIMTPMHDETYEYNTEDSEWYLVKQGQGFA